MARIPAEFIKPAPEARKLKKGLDSWRKKSRPGRRARMRASELRGRADNYRWIFDQVWERLWPLVSKAESEEEVRKALEEGAHLHSLGCHYNLDLAESRCPSAGSISDNFIESTRKNQLPTRAGFLNNLMQ